MRLSPAELARCAGLLALKAAAGVWALHAGFSHVSDDDYARVVIAERFAHAPALDPSGTSWLPFPFWLAGGAMVVLGRSLAVATAVAWLSGLASALVGYAALRAASVPRAIAWLTAALVVTSPWNAWLGVATVPEALTASLIFAGAMAASAPIDAPSGRRVRLLGGLALLAAALSRYEAWPACAVFGAFALADARSAAPRDRRALAGALALAALGPSLWLAWNAHAHGAALHFLHRVTAFHAHHGGAGSLAQRLLAYPRALAAGSPELAAVALVGAAGFRERDVRARWLRPLVTAGAVLAFLEYGEVVGGAPTHHPERALLAVGWILAGFGLDGVRSLVVRHAWARPGREAWVVALAVCAVGAVVGERVDRMRGPPGRGPEEDRAPQLARGAALREEGVVALQVVPCMFEHFALLAAFGAPERVEVQAATGGRVTAECPEVRLGQ